MVNECLLPRHRLYVYFGNWPLAFVVMALLALATRHWKWLTFAATAAGVIPLVVTFFILESPKWLLQRDRTQEAIAVLETICRKNGKSVDRDRVFITFNSCAIAILAPQADVICIWF